MKQQLEDKQADLIEVLTEGISMTVKHGLSGGRETERDLEILGEEWGMTRKETVDTLIYVRLHLHNVMVMTLGKEGAVSTVMASLKYLADWLDEIPDVLAGYEKAIQSSGSSGGKGYIKVAMPPIIKECLHIPEPKAPEVPSFLKAPSPS